MKKLTYSLIIFCSIIFTQSLLAQESKSNHEHETEIPDPQDEIKMEKKLAKKHNSHEQKMKEHHAKENLKHEKHRMKHNGTAHFGAIGYDGQGSYSGKAHKKHLAKTKKY
jgi:hypothetical protein